MIKRSYLFNFFQNFVIFLLNKEHLIQKLVKGNKILLFPL